MMKPVTAQVYRKTIASMVANEKATVVVEIGVYSGLLSRMLAALSCVQFLTLIDPWAEWPGKFDEDHMERVAQGVMSWAETEEKVRVLRQTSLDAAPMFNSASVDFWQTDGCHNYKMVKAEILAWWPKVKVGGVLCGDNYEAPSVSKAVDEILPKHDVAAKGRVWWIRKEK